MRKRKPSQDREPSKLSIKPSEHREDKARDELSSGPMEMIKKMGEKAKSVMRTSPPPERVQRVGEHTKSQTEGQSSGGTENSSDPNPTSGAVGTRQVSTKPPEVLEVTGSVGGSRGE